MFCKPNVRDDATHVTSKYIRVPQYPPPLVGGQFRVAQHPNLAFEEPQLVQAEPLGHTCQTSRRSDSEKRCSNKNVDRARLVRAGSIVHFEAFADFVSSELGSQRLPATRSRLWYLGERKLRVQHTQRRPYTTLATSDPAHSRGG